MTQSRAEIEEELIRLKHEAFAAFLRGDGVALEGFQRKMAGLREILALRSSSALPATERSKRGAPGAADWLAIKVPLAAEIDAVGFPRRAGPPGWRTNADVIRFVEKLTGDDEPGKTSLKENVSRMLAEIRQEKGRKVGK